MDKNEFQQLLALDRKRWDDKSNLILCALRPEFILMRRKRHCDYYRSKKPLGLLYMVYRWLYHRSCLKVGCDIPSHVVIGGGFKLIHGRGVVINSKAIIGENVTLLSGTVIGANRTGIPIIGNNVEIGAHSIIIGGIHVGDNAEIGAGAIVTHDVPAGGVVYGDASKVHRIKEL